MAIDLQAKAHPMEGRIESYWFENAAIGLRRTRFHRIIVPFEPFDSGIDYVEQPESPQLVVDWIRLGLEDPSQLDGVEIATGTPEGFEASIYIGSAHNWVEVRHLSIARRHGAYALQCSTYVMFENEGVGSNEEFSFSARAIYRSASE